MQKNVAVEGYQLSPQQTRIWLLQQADDSHSYVAQSAVFIEGEIDVGILKAAIAEIARRHEILRTNFHILPGMSVPLQVIEPEPVIDIREIGLNEFDPRGRQVEFEELFRKETRHSFDLRRGPVARFCLLHLSMSEKVLVTSLPAVCMDGRSLKNLFREIARTYAAASGGEDLNVQPVQYVDFAEWQKETLGREDDKDTSWDMLSPCVSSASPFMLGFERRSDTALGYSPANLSSALDGEMTARIDRISSAHNISSGVFLLACWQILVWRLTGHKDVTIDNLCESRGVEGLGEALGAFTRYCPVQAHVEPDYRFTEMFEIAGESISSSNERLDYFLRQDIRFKANGYPAERANAIGFEYEEWPAAEYAGPVKFSYWKQYVSLDRFKLKLGVYRKSDDLVIEIQYDSAIFSRESIEPIQERYLRLIESAVSNEQELIGEYEGRRDEQAKARLDRGGVDAMKAGERDGAPPLVRVLREGRSGAQKVVRLPLSFAQQRLWFLDQLAPNSPFYNIPGAVSLEGRLDLDALERVINEIVRRHEVLRTRFEVEAGEPAQVIDEWEPRSLEVTDLTSMPQEEREEEVRRISKEEAETGFDLSRGPLLRVKLLKLEEERHVLLYTMHHVVSDAWSTGILIGEVGALYQAYSMGGEGEASPLEELPIQYADFAVWQRAWLQGEALERQLEYWRKQLAGMEDLELPVDRPRPAAPSFQGAEHRFVIEREVAEKLRELCQREGMTLFMTLLGGFDVLMSRYSGQEDVALGTDIANRNRAEIEGLIGFFVNQLVMRVRVRASESFRALLKRVKNVCLEAYAHQDVPFEKLVEELRPERDLSRAPLFQTKLILQNATQENMELGGAKVSVVGAAEIRTTKLDLTVSITDMGADAGRDLIGVANYSRDIFEQETIGRLMGHYVNVLSEIARGAVWPEGLIEEGGIPVSELSLLSEAERKQIVVEWNQTGKPYPNDRCVHELFSEQAERIPEQIALISKGRQVSYRELNRRANQLGNYLRGLGVGPEVVVGLCLERSVEMVVGLLGALKAGGAYLPLDPESPLERLGYMLEDAGVGVVLTERGLEGRLPVFWGQTVLMDEEWEKIGAESEGDPENEVGSENLAYVIYTSGSTGWPKGVMVRHRSLANYAHDICRQLGLLEGRREEGLRFATVSTITADLGNTCIYPSLVSGGCLHVLTYEAATDGARFEEYVRRNPIDVLKIVPSHLGALLGSQPNGVKMLPDRYLIFGGEALAPELVEGIRGRGPVCEVINHYGPTETTIGSLTMKVREEEENWGKRATVPIGRPIANTEAYILDRGLKPAPAGARGELYIAGEGVARGYWGRPDFTAERFIPNLLGREGGDRLYRTGDVCRYLPDGKIEFVGRADDQVKLRGYRIELGEIEAVLNEHRSVNQSVVVAREGAESGKRLLGYVVGEGGVTSAELKRHVRARLPEYMVPEAIILLEKIPLTANGKIDRKALPSVIDAGQQTEREVAGARTPIEEMVVGIFEEVLKVDRVGRDDNFFEIGGHSLLATQVASRLRSTFGVEIGVGIVFEEATAEGLAGRIEEAMKAGEMDGGQPLVRSPRGGRLPLSFAQQRLWFIDQLIPNSSLYNIPHAVSLEGRLDLEVLERVINEIVRRHEILRTRFEVEDGEPAQVIDEWEPRKLDIEDLTSLIPEEREKEVQRIAREEGETGFDLSKGPLLRVKVLKLQEEEHFLLFTMSHIVSDGWSMGILSGEVRELTRAYSAGEPSPLRELPIQYADFAVWQRKWLTGDLLERQLSYWRNQLAGLEQLNLPTDRARPITASHRGGIIPFTLSAETTLRLVELSRKEGATRFMTLLAVFQLLLSRYCGQQDVAVGTDIANRDRVETEGLIGFFVNQLVLRTDLSGDPDFRGALKSVREVALGAYANQDLPFDRLVEELQPERNPGRTPLFQVAMAFYNASQEDLRLEDQATAIVGAVNVQAKYDLTLFVGERGAGLRGAVEYASDLFDESTIARFIEHFRVALECVLARPERPISEIEFLSQAELDQILRVWNGASRAYPTGLCIHELIERQVEKTPHAIALVDGARSLSYEQLERSANQLAHYLRGLGVGPDVVVALCVNRSLEMVMALVGILKAGGAYVPIDPKYPAERIAFMLEDAEAAVLLTEEGLRASLPESRPYLVSLDGAWKEIAQHSEASPKAAAQPGHLAYVIYTSGSTGRPKGAMVSHHSLVNYVYAVSGRLEMSSADRVLQFASISFDVAIEEIFPTLAAGGTVVIDGRGVVASFSELERLLADEQISWVELPTAYWQAWVADLGTRPGNISGSMRLVIVGGERMAPESVQVWARTGVRLLHIYGLTETTITSCLYQVGEEQGKAEIAIGWPIENTWVYILDDRRRPAPMGVGGELCIAGEGVARGYIRRPVQTAERFVPNPHGERPGERMYRTGDKARRLGDGRIEFLGRVDDQVKVRGYRVETGEIAAALKSHPTAEEVAVIAVENGSGGNKLIAYVVPKYEYRQSIDQNGAAADKWKVRVPELWPAQGEYGIFDEVLYYSMSNDEVRNKSYEEAMRRLVRGKVVVDIGTGADAVLSRMCIKAGASKVYAIEMGEESYRKAKREIKRERLEDQIILVLGVSAEVELPEKADVCVSELIGTIGSAEGVVPILNDARRFLKEDGVMIPERCVTKIAGVELPEAIRRDMAFTEVSGHYANKVFEQMGRMFDLRLCIRNFPKSNLISSIDLFEELDFKGNIEPGSTKEISLRVNRKARLEGLLLWINLEVVEGEVIDVLEYDGCWSPAYMPVFPSGIEVAEGDEIRAGCSVIYGGNGGRPDYQVKGVVIRKGGKDIEFDYHSRLEERSYKGNEFYEELLSGAAIKISRDHKEEAITSRLKNHLSGMLPEYMIPAAIVMIDKLPLTPNGKIDRRALPRPEPETDGREIAAPRSAVGEILAGIMAEVLKLDGVGISDNFFEIGGHSLSATQVASRVKDAIGVEIGVRSVFETATVEGLARRIEDAIRAGEKDETPPLVKAPGGARLPLSFAQQRLWFLDRLAPNNPFYNIPGAVSLEGRLDLDALERSVNEIVRRHETLRTRFEAEAGEPVQVIDEWEPRRVEIEDLTKVPREEREGEVSRIVRREVGTGFDLSRGPLLRVRVLKLDEEEHVLLYTIHHIVSDGWSMGILSNEVEAVYQAYMRGEKPPLEELPIQYADFAVWQRAWLQGAALERQLEYWRKQLAGLESLELPTDHPRPAAKSYHGASRSFRVERELAEGLRALSRRQGVTLFMTLLGGFEVLMSRYSGQEDIALGTDIANRNRAEIEGLIGFFVNQLVLRVEVRAGESFVGLLKRVREVCLGAYAHQDVPFEKLVEELRPERDLSRAPFFQVNLTLENAPGEVTGLEGMALTSIGGGETQAAKLDLTAAITDAGSDLFGGFVYSRDLFEEVTIERLMGHYTNVLREIVDSRRPVSELSLLSDQERKQIVVEWNETGRPYPEDQRIHELFEQQVKAGPETIALIYEDQQLTYAELNARANQLAHYLRRRGVGAETLVGVSAERSLEMVVGLFAILKAGGAYVPLDPGHPVEHLNYMLEDSAPVAVLTQPWTQGKIGSALADAGAPMIDLESDTWLWASEPCIDIDRTAVGQAPERLAYVIYTSGSTGRPKGVMNGHRGVVNRLLWMQDAYGLNRQDAVLQKTPFSFDVSVWEFFWPLLNGARLVMARAEGHKDPAYLADIIQQQSVTTLHFVPSMLQVFLEHNGAPKCSSLARVICSGETLSGSLAGRFRERLDRTGLYNLYGPTEAAVDVTAWTYTAGAYQNSVPIGHPIANTQIYLLDRCGQPVPVGAPGEIHIGGVQVARGYLNRPELTAERFTADPFAAEVGARMYKTGDLGRYLPNGEIEYLRRNDFQVKIRGVRIELGEIAARLAQHPAIREAVVLAREDSPGEKRLTAYYTLKVAEAAASTVDAEALRGYLSAELPEYLVPAAYVSLEALPITPNGKLDRRALPAPGWDAYAAGEYEAPLGEIETALAQIWAELLKLERVGRHDNFFALGGHSLLAVILVERMRRAGLHADVRALFTAPTLAALAAAAAAASDLVEVPPNRIPPGCEAITPEMLPLVQLSAAEIEQVVGAVPGGAANIQDIYPLAPLQEGILFHHLMSPEGDIYLMTSWLSFDSRERLERFVEAMQVVISRHDILRTAVLWEGLPEPVQVVWRRAPLEVEEVSIDPEADAVEELRAQFDTRRYRIDVRRAPLMRVCIAYDRREGRWVMLHLVHHLSMDHAAMEILKAEVQALLSGRAEELPEPLPFRNFVAQARLGVGRQEHESFFREMLAGVDEPTAPFGLMDVQGDWAGIREARREVDAELCGRLRKRARALGVSAASLYHLALAQVLARVSGREDVVFGTILFGRMSGGEGADRVPGVFINTLPIRIRIDGESVEESVRRTHKLLAQLLRHEHAPLALAQRCSAIKAPAPLFSALLNYRYSGRAEAVAEERRSAWEGIGFLGGEERSNYPLSMNVDDLGEGFTLDAQAQSPADPDRICAYLHTALERLVEALEQAPGTPARNLNVLPESERRQLLVEWNETENPYPDDQCIHELFERQVERLPDAIVLIYEDQQLTYAELNARANQLAHYLRRLGVGPETLVGVCVERSLEMVVGLLAILKAGGAYVPLDPAYPIERLAYMLENSAPAALLIHGEVGMGLARRLHAVPTLNLDSDAPQWAGQSERNLGRDGAMLDARNPAYVIYTSGSTGRPKGVMIPHYALCNHMLWMQESFALSRTDRVLQKTPFSFDASVWEFYMPLLFGAQLVMAKPGGHRDSAYLVSEIAEREITILQAVPSLLQILVEEAGWEKSRSLRRMFCGGEALSWKLVAKFRAVSGAQVINLYGPTEVTIESIYWECSEDLRRGLVPIGRPITNTQAYISDERFEPSPVGVRGELYLGGTGLARGYLNQPELTAERFLPDPFGRGRGARIYRTGDLGRWLSDGKIEFLGRDDFQLKFRGFRIELGEIEDKLAGHPNVREAAALAREDNGGDKRLVAYYTGEESEAEALRSHLLSGLPEYMVPAAYVYLNSFPLTPNGKLDRRALPAPADWAYVRRGYQPPVGETETRLARIWAEVLGLEQVGRDENFFELGGHSLLAVNLIERMRRAGLHADVRALFTTSTLAELAVVVSGGSGLVEVPPNRIPPGCEAITPEMLPLAQLSAAEIEQVVGAVPGGAANIQDIYPLAPLQEGILFHHLMSTEGDIYLTASWLSFDSRERLESFVEALQAVISRHDILRTAVLWEGLPEPVQVVWRWAPLEVEEVSLDQAAGDAAEELWARFDPRHYRLDVRRAPMMRVCIAYDRREDRWVALHLVHHLSMDHAALEILQEEVRAHLSGRAKELPEPLPFRNFVAQARLGVSRQEHESFFREMLAGVDEPTAPFGLTDVQGDGSGIRGARREVDAQLSHRLRQRARALGVSAASLYHLAWARVMARVSGKEDVVFGTILFGRMGGGEGADRVPGMFINTLPIRIRMGGEGVEESVRQTHKLLAQLLRHEHAPLALAQRCSAVDASAPLFSALFNYRHSVVMGAAGEELSAWEGIEFLGNKERSNYPLTMSVDDLGEEHVLGARVESPADPDRICAYLHTALERLVEALEQAPTTPIDRLDVLPASERNQLLVEWNATEAEYPHEQSIHTLFEAQAARTPDAIAVTQEDCQLSYGELNARADRLAHELRALEVRPGARVATLLPRSIELALGELAILKCGAAYAPLDQNAPAERQASVIEDCQAEIVLTVEGLDAPESAKAKRVNIDAEALEKRAAHNFAAPLNSEAPAYVIYTSGSTGRPKGVVVPHRAIGRLAFNNRYAAFEAGDRVAFTSNPAFDASTMEVWGPLLHGGCVVVIPQAVLLEPNNLADFLRQQQVNILHLVAGLLAAYADPLAPVFPSLRYLLTGGDVVDPQAVAKVLGQSPPQRLVHCYGPSESTTFATTQEVVDVPAKARSLPIGRPIGNTQVYILDREQETVPVGVVGELYVGGKGVACGYFGQSELTAERFLPDAFGAESGARLYRTGDMARYLSDGIIEFLGRIDHQVKIRGFRIELGEIEAQINSHPAVRQCVVMAHQDETGEKTLWAYVVCEEEGASSVDELRGYLRKWLPEYMLPAGFVRLEQMPLTPNGKVDRQALAEIEVKRSEGRAGRVAPRTPVEEILTGIFEDVLSIDRVGIDDNFFDFGGHSLLATQVVSRITVALGVEIGVARIFEEPRARGLALRIEELIGTGMKPEAPQDAAPEERFQYWKKQLDDKPPVLDLAGAHLRPESRAYRAVTKSISLPAELCEPLKALSKREGATLHMILLTAFKTMLYRYTAESDIAVMAAVSNRNQPDAENPIGISGDLLPLRTNLGGNPRFIQLLKRVKDVVLGAYLHQEAPWENLIEEMGPGQKAGPRLPFNIAFWAQNAPEGEMLPTETRIDSITVGQESARFDLTLWVTKGADTIQAGWTYSADLFEEGAIVRMHSHFESLLRSVVARPDAPLDELEMLSEAEKTQQAINRAIRKERNYSKFKGVKPKVITPSKE